jgi:glycosyltransferase involved in cell wall biosynthesis
MRKKVSIITPIYNDFEALNFLLDEIQGVISGLPNEYDWSVLVVDDGSLNDISIDGDHLDSFSFKLRCIKLTLNGGHQVAIANGLKFVQSEINPDLVIVMDGDGEDDVGEIPTLVEKLDQEMIVVCSRLSRTEGVFFQSAYYVFKILFKIFTGYSLNFGNFCGFNNRVLGALTQSSMTESSLAATILYLRIPIFYHWVAKRNRYCGSSKMKAISLIEFAIGHLKVFSKKITLKIFIGIGVFVFIEMIAIGFILAMKFYTEAPSGWTSLALLITFFAGIQAFLIGLLAVLNTSNNQAPVDNSSCFTEIPCKLD